MTGARVTQAELARLLGVHKSTVSRWVSAGRIEVGADGLVDPAAAAAMRDATESALPHHQARKLRWEQDKAERATVGATGPETGLQRDERGGVVQGHQPGVDRATAAQSGRQEAVVDGSESPMSEAVRVGLRMKAAMMAEREAKAELARMEVDRLAGVLAERSEFEFVLADFGQALRARLEGLADRLAGELAAHRGDTNAIHASISEATREVLDDLAELMRRRAAQVGGAS